MMEWIVSSSALILMILALRYLLKGKISLRLQYALWALVLLRLLTPVNFFSTNISIQNLAAELSRQPATQAAQAISEYNLPKQSYSAAYEQVVQEYQAQGINVETLKGSEKEALDYEAMERMESDVTVGELLADVALALWLMGVAVVLGFTAVSNLRFRAQLRRDRIALDVPDTGLPVYVSSRVETPCIFGVFHPTIYLTPDVAEDKTKLRHVLEHEMTHYYHCDYITAPLRCVALALHWYNPLVWIAAKVSRQDGELACDEGTIARLGEEERIDYGRTLIQLTCEHSSIGDVMLTATTMTGSRKSIKERIQRIAKQPKMAAVTLIAVILVATVAVGCTFTGAREDASTQEEVLDLLEREGQSHLNKIAVVQLDEESYGTDGVAIFLPEEIVMDYFHANVGATDRNGNLVSLQGEIQWEAGKWVIVEDLEQYQELIFQSFYSIDPEDTVPDKQRHVDLLHLEQAAANRTNGAAYEGNVEKLLMEEGLHYFRFERAASPGNTAVDLRLPKLVQAEQAAQQGLYLFETADGSVPNQTVYLLMRYDGQWEYIAAMESYELDALYATDAMLAEYPTKYDAAAIEVYWNGQETEAADLQQIMSVLTAGDIKAIDSASGSITDVSLEMLATTIQGAAENIVEHTQWRINHWSLNIYLSGGPDVFSADDEHFTLSAGTTENIVLVQYWDGNGMSLEVDVEDEALYWLIRDAYKYKDAIDEVTTQTDPVPPETEVSIRDTAAYKKLLSLENADQFDASVLEAFAQWIEDEDGFLEEYPEEWELEKLATGTIGLTCYTPLSEDYKRNFYSLRYDGESVFFGSSGDRLYTSVSREEVAAKVYGAEDPIGVDDALKEEFIDFIMNSDWFPWSTLYPEFRTEWYFVREPLGSGTEDQTEYIQLYVKVWDLGLLGADSYLCSLWYNGTEVMDGVR